MDYESEDNTIKLIKGAKRMCPHGWPWAPVREEFHRVEGGKIVSYPPERLTRSATVPEPAVLDPSRESTLRSGTLKRIARTATFDPTIFPKLEHDLPRECLPDILEVRSKATSVRYRRALPPPGSSGSNRAMQTSILTLGHGEPWRSL